MNEGKRLLSVFVSPRSLFEDLLERPRWWLPFIIVCVVAAGAAAIQLIPVLNQLGGFEVMLERARATRPDLDADSVRTMFFVSPTIFRLILQAVVLMVSGLVFWAAFAIFGADINFKKSMTVVSYSGLIIALGALVTALIQLIVDSTLVNASFAFLPFLDPHSYIFRLVYMLDFFAVWHVIVMGLGFSIVSKKSKLTSYLIVAIAWVCFALLAAALMGGGVRVR